jgi:hypothetical protein
MNPILLSTSTAWNSVAGFFKKFIKWFLILIVVVGGIIIYWNYFKTYSEGLRVGLLQKFSKRGDIIKTYEGEMILSSVSSSRDVVLASEKFLFSLSNKKIVRQFDTLQGEMVIVHYKQKKKAAFWRGDSPYLVDSVTVKR